MPPSLIRNSNSVTALHKHQKSNLSDLEIQKAPSNEFKDNKNSGTAGATGSSIHFTLEENSQNQQIGNKANQRTPTNNSSAQGIFGSISKYSGENKFRFPRLHMAGFSSNQSSSGSEDREPRRNQYALSRNNEGPLRRFHTALAIPTQGSNQLSISCNASQ